MVDGDTTRVTGVDTTLSNTDGNRSWLLPIRGTRPSDSTPAGLRRNHLRHPRSRMGRPVWMSSLDPHRYLTNESSWFATGVGGPACPGEAPGGGRVIRVAAGLCLLDPGLELSQGFGTRVTDGVLTAADVWIGGQPMISQHRGTRAAPAWRRCLPARRLTCIGDRGQRVLGGIQGGGSPPSPTRKTPWGVGASCWTVRGRPHGRRPSRINDSAKAGLPRGASRLGSDGLRLARPRSRLHWPGGAPATADAGAG